MRENTKDEYYLKISKYSSIGNSTLLFINQHGNLFRHNYIYWS